MHAIISWIYVTITNLYNNQNTEKIIFLENIKNNILKF